MAPKFHLTLSPGACSIAPHILLREAGVDFTTTIIHVNAGFPKEYLHLNPKGCVPILEIDDETITENPAVLTAIAQQAPSLNLLGRTPLEIVRVYEWMNWLSGHVHGQGFGGLFRPTRFTDDRSADERIKAKARETIKEAFEAIDGKLKGREWAVGQGFTAVDAYLVFFWKAGAGNGFEMGRYPEYRRVMEKVAKRESVAEVVKAEGIELGLLR